jgi:hypothetical protein
MLKSNVIITIFIRDKISFTQILIIKKMINTHAFEFKK